MLSVVVLDECDAAGGSPAARAALCLPGDVVGLDAPDELEHVARCATLLLLLLLLLVLLCLLVLHAVFFLVCEMKGRQRGQLAVIW